MKPILKIAAYILFTVPVLFVACKKESPITSVVTPPPPPPNSNLQLIPFGTLSQARYNTLAATAGNKILFVGGRYVTRHCGYDSSDNIWYDCENQSSRVDIYDTSTRSWSTTELNGSGYNSWSSVASVGDKFFFAGGYYSSSSGRMDIYNASTNAWSTMELPEARYSMAVVSLRDKIFFAGGSSWGGGVSARVDIYDNSTNSWSTATLSEARTILAGTSVGNKILFAGGSSGSKASGTVDIYDASTNTWSTATLSQAREHPAAISSGNKAFFAGGSIGTASYLGRVDIYDNSTQSWSANEVAFYSIFFNAASLDNKVLFFTWVNGNYVNVYDTYYNSWTLHEVSQSFAGRAVIKSGNQIYVAGGQNNWEATNQVWRVQF